jgi:hypothetical protein
MKTTTSICIALFVVFSATMAIAAPKRKKGKRKAPAATATNCETTGVSIKRCYVDGDAAEFALTINRGSTLLVTLEEPPVFTSGDPYMQSEASDTSVLFKMRKDSLPKGHSLVIRTATTTITLMFSDVTSGGDSQVHIARADNAGRDSIVEARVEARLAEYKAEHKKALNNLEKKAARLSRDYLLNELHERGSRITAPAGAVRAREDFLVFRATKTVRIGKERFLQVSIEERKGDTFSIRDFKVEVTQKGAKRTLDADFRCGDMRVRPGKVVGCFVSLGGIDKKRGRALVDIVVVGEDGERSASLRGVDIR